MHTAAVRSGHAGPISVVQETKKMKHTCWWQYCWRLCCAVFDERTEVMGDERTTYNRVHVVPCSKPAMRAWCFRTHVVPSFVALASALLRRESDSVQQHIHKYNTTITAHVICLTRERFACRCCRRVLSAVLVLQRCTLRTNECPTRRQLIIFN